MSALYSWSRFGLRTAAAAAGVARHPTKLIFVVTTRCHSRCVYCDIWKVKETPGGLDRQAVEIEPDGREHAARRVLLVEEVLDRRLGSLVFAADQQARAVGRIGEGAEEFDIPTVTIYSPSPDRATGAAIVVCPGGGYGGFLPPKTETAPPPPADATACGGRGFGNPAAAYQRIRQLGVTHLLGLYFAANSVQELLDQMQIFGEEVTPRIR